MFYKFIRMVGSRILERGQVTLLSFAAKQRIRAVAGRESGRSFLENRQHIYILIGIIK